MGYHRLAIPRDRVRELIDGSYEIDYFMLRSEYRVQGDDHTKVTAAVRIGDRRHEVRDLGGVGPSKVHDLEWQIFETVEPLVGCCQNQNREPDQNLEWNWSC